MRRMGAWAMCAIPVPTLTADELDTNIVAAGAPTSSRRNWRPRILARSNFHFAAHTYRHRCRWLPVLFAALAAVRFGYSRYRDGHGDFRVFERRHHLSGEVSIQGGRGEKIRSSRRKAAALPTVSVAKRTKTSSHGTLFRAWPARTRGAS